MYNFEQIKSPSNTERKAEIPDIPMIKELLSSGLYENLSEKEKNGGLFFNPSEEELMKMIDDTGIMLSMRGETLKGYYMTMSKELAQEMPMMAEFIKNAEPMDFKEKTIGEYKYVLLVQILIRKEFRGGKTTFLSLHNETYKMLALQGYEVGIGEIRDENTHSKKSHGFLDQIGQYTDSKNNLWNIMAVDIAKDIADY